MKARGGDKVLVKRSLGTGGEFFSEGEVLVVVGVCEGGETEEVRFQGVDKGGEKTWRRSRGQFDYFDDVFHVLEKDQ